MKLTKKQPQSAAAMACAVALVAVAKLHAGTFTSVEINNPITAQVVTNADLSITVTAGGGDAYDNPDSFSYLYESRTGDFDISVQVLNVDADDASGSQSSSKGGLMVRANLTPGSPNIQVSATPDQVSNYRVETIARVNQDAGTDDPPENPFFHAYDAGPYVGTFQPNDSGALFPIWLRASRHGNLFQTMCSTDGIAWKILAEYSFDTNRYPETLYVGLATVAHNGDLSSDNRVRSTYAGYHDTAVPPVATVSGTPAGDSGPGAWPVSSVTGVNWSQYLPADGISRNTDGSSAGQIIWNSGGFATTSRDELLSIAGQGPIPWSTTRYACGAIDFGLSPRDAVDGQSNLGPYSNPNRARSVTDPALAPAAAWAPSPRYGVALITSRTNGPVQWNDGAAPFYPHTFIALDFSSATYFQMDDMVGFGVFQNGGHFYTRGAKLGDTAAHPDGGANSSGGFQRAAFDFSLAWFPYDGGWVAGSFADASKAPAVGWTEPGAHSAAAVVGSYEKAPNDAAALLSWTDLGDGTYGGLAKLTLPNVNSSKDGLLFLVPNDDTSNRGPQANAAATTDGSGWKVAVRLVDENKGDPSAYAPAGSSEFSFLYIPYTANNLIGAQITGATGATVHSAGNFTVTRLSTGRYLLSLPGKQDTNGMFLLQPVGTVPGNPALVDNNTLTYAPSTNGWIVESRIVEPGAGPGGFDAYTLRDSDFYFAWVDFTNPVTLAALPAAPKLTATASAGGVTISWPASVTGFTLQSTDVLVGGSWTTVAGVANNSVTVASPTGNRFYRLIQ
ncbi:MAG TPA: hypothetical protein VMF06_04845 [Candidatus Limnocylindria bacterium]|jgi:hypothetical protein|nr:hypothetical protein [Candidatus Limnocylindria bacterium]